MEKAAKWSFEAEPGIPCQFCLDSGLLAQNGNVYPCNCESGWAQQNRERDYCGKLISEKAAVAIYSRPSVLHFFSRLYLMCDPCFKGFRRYRGLPDYHTTIAPDGLRCGSLVVVVKRGNESSLDSVTAPDYMPVEDPRRFGASARGGAMKEFYDSFRKTLL